MDLVDRGCDGIFIGEDTAQDCPDEASATASPSALASDEPTEEPTDSPTPEPTLIGTPVPNVSIAPWDGKERAPKYPLDREIDAETARRARRSLDVSGHYSRPDIFSFAVDRRALPPVVFSD